MFLIESGALEGRIDVHFYKPEFFELENRIKKLGIEFSNLKKLSKKIFSGVTPLSGGDAYTDKENGIMFVRSGDYSDQNEIAFEDLIYLKKEVHKQKMKHSQLQKNDILIAIVGATIGKVGVYKFDFEANINQAICAVRLKENTNPDFVHCFLLTNVGQKFLDRIKRPVARANINLDEIGSLQIPILPLATQSAIVAIFQTAYESKKAKETEAKELLASIDAYLLEMLGIVLPQKVKTPKTFFVNFSQVQGNRFDPFYHKTEFKALEKSLQNGKYEVVKLGNYLQNISYGASVKNEYVDDTQGGIPFLRISDLKRNQINVKEIVYLSSTMRKELGNCFVQENDFLISRSGTTGVVAMVDKSVDGFAYGSFMIKFVLKENAPINKNFLSYYLNSEIMQIIVERNRIGAIQGNITIPTIRNFEIPLPPLSVQEEIALYISGIRSRAKALGEEAKNEIEKAKLLVEEMILG